MNSKKGLNRIMSALLAAMSFGTQGAYAGKKDNANDFGVSVSSKSKGKGRDINRVKNAKKKKRSKGKGVKTGNGRRAGRVNVDGDKALRIVRDAKSKGHKVNVKKVALNKAEVTVTDEDGNTVTYVVGGVLFAVIAAVIGLSLYSKGTQKGGEDKKEKEKTEKDKEKDKEKTEKEKAGLVDEIKKLCARCKKMLVSIEVDNLDPLDINALKSKKTELEESLKEERAKLAPIVGFMLEFSPKEGKFADNLDALLDDDFASVYSEFISNSLAFLVYNMVNNLKSKIGGAGSVIKIAEKDVKTPLDMLGFENYDEIKDAWGTPDVDNLSTAFNEWFSGEYWKDRTVEKKKKFGFFGGGKETIKGTTFKQYWDSEYKAKE